LARDAKPAPNEKIMYAYQQPDPSGHFGIYGGSFVSETLTHAINELKALTPSTSTTPRFWPNSNTNWRILSAAPPRFTTQPA
jgi:tryptophan synthase beta subunit